MPVPFKVFSVLISKTPESFLLAIEELPLVERLVSIDKLALPANLAFVPLSLVIVLKGSNCEIDFADAMRVKLSYIYLSFVPSAIFVLNVRPFCIKVFYFYFRNICILLELD